MTKHLFAVALLALMLAIVPARAHAQIAFEAVGSGGNFTPVSEQTWTHDIAAGSDRIVFVSFYMQPGFTPVVVTFDGVAPTQIGSAQAMGSATHYVYKLTGHTATGTMTVSITPNASAWIAGQSVSYTGAGDPNVLESSFTTGSSAGSHVDDLTTITDNSWVILLAANEGGNLTADTGATQRVRNANTLSTGIYDSNGVITPAGNHEMTLTGNAGDWAFVLVALPPAGTVAVSPSRLMLMGAGDEPEMLLQSRQMSDASMFWVVNNFDLLVEVGPAMHVGHSPLQFARLGLVSNLLKTAHPADFVFHDPRRSVGKPEPIQPAHRKRASLLGPTGDPDRQAKTATHGDQDQGDFDGQTHRRNTVAQK